MSIQARLNRSVALRDKGPRRGDAQRLQVAAGGPCGISGRALVPLLSSAARPLQICCGPMDDEE